MRDSRTRQPAGEGPDPHAATDQALERLGLEPHSPIDDAAVAHDELVAFLATAPRSVRAWAHARAQEVDAAYASLMDTVAGGDARPDALVGGEEPAATLPGEPARQPARRDVPVPVAAPTALSEDDRIEQLLASVTPSFHRDSLPDAPVPAPAPVAAVAAPSAQSAPAGQRTVSIRIPGRRALVTMGLLLVVGVGAVAVYGMGNQTPAATTPQNGGTAAATPAATLDEAKVAELMKRIAADPNDADALLGIGDEYFQIADYTSAAGWFEKAAAAAPTNVMAQLALGAALYNANDLDGAEIHWQKAVTLDPKNVEGHYDLGFLYETRQPPDIAGVQREWTQVIALAPGTDIAKTVKTHLDALTGAAPGSSGGPEASGAPAASAAPVASAGAAPATTPVASAPDAAPSAAPTPVPVATPAAAASTLP